jgi:hypothetical protein
LSVVHIIAAAMPTLVPSRIKGEHIMVAINPDPHSKGYKFSPIHCVVAIFGSSDQFPEVAQRLLEEGITDEHIAVFIGEEGILKLDSNGSQHGMVTRVMRDLEQFFTDETDLLLKVDEALSRGGCAVRVYTGRDRLKKERVTQIAKAQGAEEVSYWGNLVTERL